VNEEVRRSVIVTARERALAYPAHIEQPLAFGTRQYRFRIRRSLAIVLVAAVVVVGGLLAVHPAVGEAFSPRLTGLTVSPSTLELRPAEEATLTVTLVYSDGSAEPAGSGVVEWTSSGPTVVGVTAEGAVLAHAVGAATITARAGDRSSQSIVTVLPVTLTNIVLTPASVELPVGDTVTLSARGEYADGTTRPLGETLGWSTGDAGVASVDESGVVSAHAVGAVIVTATGEGVSATASVTVTAPVEPTGVRVTPAEVALAVGGTAQLTAVTVLGDGTTAPLTDAATSWHSSNEKVAQVNHSGLVTARSAGTATITATADGLRGTASVTVTTPPTLTSITLSPSDANLAPGETVQFTATGHYGSTTSAPLDSAAWSSSDESAVTVTASGLATAVGEGTSATITATVDGISGTAPVTVSMATPRLIRITVSPADTDLNVVGESVQLTATGHYSDDTTAVLDSAAWASSSPAVAVSNTGLATVIAEGSDATITATVDDVTGRATVDAPQVVE
jgi:uncharacterized protein YjdB